MLELNEINLRVGVKTLLEQASVRLDLGQIVGLVGRNGAGKTSVLKLLTGQLHEDHGTMSMPAFWQIAHLQQTLPTSNGSIHDYVRDGDTAWVALQEKIIEAEKDDDGILLGQCYADLENIDGYQIDYRVDVVLQGLGFSMDELHQPVKSFSGGWQMRLQLARVLMSRAELLLLDEPTNHLDLETIIWLEQWIKKNHRLIIIVSHDREFLDHTTTHTLSLSAKNLDFYSGNYTAFLKQSSEKKRLLEKSNEKVVKQRQHLESFISRFKAKASKAKQAQSRVKALEKLQLSTVHQEERAYSFQFLDTKETGYPTMKIHADLGYENKTVLFDVDVIVDKEDRIGIIGVNGSGKSTLIKSIAQEIATRKGNIEFHSNINIGYFSQDQLDTLTLDNSPLAHLVEIDKDISESAARKFLGRMGFQNEAALSPIRSFSGGEKARLALSLLIWGKPNVLVLDEPTNHLDMSMRESLIFALQNFNGAVLLVSHDRYFVECCVDTLWLVKDGSLKLFKGTLTDYENSQIEKIAPSAQKQKTDKKEKPVSSVKNLQKLEKAIAKLQKKLEEIDKELADPTLYDAAQSEKLAALNQLRLDAKISLDKKEAKWLKLIE